MSGISTNGNISDLQRPQQPSFWRHSTGLGPSNEEEIYQDRCKSRVCNSSNLSTVFRAPNESHTPTIQPTHKSMKFESQSKSGRRVKIKTAQIRGGTPRKT